MHESFLGLEKLRHEIARQSPFARDIDEHARHSYFYRVAERDIDAVARTSVVKRDRILGFIPTHPPSGRAPARVRVTSTRAARITHEFYAYLLRFDDFIAHDVTTRVVYNDASRAPVRAFRHSVLVLQLLILNPTRSSRARPHQYIYIAQRAARGVNNTRKSPSSTRRSDRRSYSTTRACTCRTACSRRARRNGYIYDDSSRTRDRTHRRCARG